MGCELDVRSNFTRNNGLWDNVKFGGELNLIGDSDSDWDGSIDDVKSTFGYAFLF